MNNTFYFEVGNDDMPITYNIQKAVDGAEMLNYRTKPFNRVDLLSGKIKPSSGIIVASIDGVRMLFGLHNIKVPSIDYPDFLFKNSLIDRTISISTINNFIGNYSEPKFVKPKSVKLFDGCVIRNESQFSYLNRFDGDTEIYVSDTMPKILSEHRIYVHENRVVYGCSYSGDFRLSPDYDLADRIVEAGKGEMPIAYTIDLAVCEDGVSRIIELNDFYSIGSYGMEACLYARMLEDRWDQIVERYC